MFYELLIIVGASLFRSYITSCIAKHRMGFMQIERRTIIINKKEMDNRILLAD